MHVPRSAVRSRGFGLFEIMLVFAILLGASAIVFAMYQSAQASASAADDNERLNALISNLRALSGPNHQYTFLPGAYSPGTAYNDPGNMSAFGKLYTIKGAVASAPDGSTLTVSDWSYDFEIGDPIGGDFFVTVTNIPQNVCPKLLAAVVGNGSAYSGVALGNSGYSNGYSWIAMNNTSESQTEGYGNISSPGFGTYASLCGFIYQEGYQPIIILVGR
jgi:type II secretory pathway pseudopilin PulG